MEGLLLFWELFTLPLNWWVVPHVPVLILVSSLYRLQGFSENLHAVFCLAENAIGPLATRPDDVHILYSGIFSPSLFVL